MLFGYHPTKTRSVLHRRFKKNNSDTIFKRSRRFKKIVDDRLMYTLLFWIFMLFSLRIGSIVFFSLAPLADRSYQGLAVFTPYPEIYDSNYLINDKSILIWIDRDQKIVVDNLNVEIEDLEKFLLTNYLDKSKDKLFLYNDISNKMAIYNRLIPIIKKLKLKKIIFVTSNEKIGIW